MLRRIGMCTSVARLLAFIDIMHPRKFLCMAMITNTRGWTPREKLLRFAFDRMAQALAYKVELHAGFPTELPNDMCIFDEELHYIPVCSRLWRMLCHMSTCPMLLMNVRTLQVMSCAIRSFCVGLDSPPINKLSETRMTHTYIVAYKWLPIHPEI
jgi:hypothetical protein